MFPMSFKSMAFSAVFLLMTPGKLKSDSLLVASVIIGTAAIVVALITLPALALEPVIEHLRLAVTKQTSPC
jgi:K+-transporting ATPase A subunit